MTAFLLSLMLMLPLVFALPRMVPARVAAKAPRR